MADTLEDCVKTPLYDVHVTKAGRMVPFGGYALPVHYAEGIMAEHVWTRQHAGLFDVSHMGQVTLSGAGADVALEALLPGEIIGLTENRIRYSLFLDKHGGILDDLMVTRRADDLFLVVNGAVKHADIAHMRAHLEPKNIIVTYMDNHALMALQGPEAAVALTRLAPLCASLKFMQAGAMTVAGVECWVSRSGYTGEDGFEISVPAEQAATLAEKLLAEPEVKCIGLGARDSLRLEAGLPLYGHDITTQYNPVEADLSFAISKRRKTGKGFPGADKIMDQLLNGAPSKRIGLKLDGRQPVREGAIVYKGDEPVGVVTSGGFSPTLQQPVAMAYVTADCSADGTQLDIEVRGRKLQATVSPMPFVPHKYFR